MNAARQIGQILKTLETPSPKRIEEVRALNALELIATPEAIRLLDDLAAGAKQDFLTRAVTEACTRLRNRSTR